MKQTICVLVCFNIQEKRIEKNSKEINKYLLESTSVEQDSEGFGKHKKQYFLADMTQLSPDKLV